MLKRLEATPPQRKADKKGRFIEPEQSWLARSKAYEMALARERAALEEA